MHLGRIESGRECIGGIVRWVFILGVILITSILWLRIHLRRRGSCLLLLGYDDDDEKGRAKGVV